MKITDLDKAALDYDKLLDKLRGSQGEKIIRDKQNALITSLNLKLSGVRYPIIRCVVLSAAATASAR